MGVDRMQTCAEFIDTFATHSLTHVTCVVW